MHFLAVAKEKVDVAIATVEAGVRPEAEIDKLLCDAVVTACEALTRLHNEDVHWNHMDKQDALVALAEIKKRDGERPHFDNVCLPVTANALRRLGLKPPEKAEILVSNARTLCDSLSSDAFDFDSLVTRARIAVKELADATCGLAPQLRRGLENREARKIWRERATSLLKWAGRTLAGALMSHLVGSSDLNALSEAGKHAVCIVAAREIEFCASQGVESANQGVESEMLSALLRATQPSSGQTEGHTTKAQGASQGASEC